MFGRTNIRPVKNGLNVHKNHKAYCGREEGGEGVWRWEKREIRYLSLHCHHQNDSCMKMGNDESHFNVSLMDRSSIVTVTDSHKTGVHKQQPFWRERRAEAVSNRIPSAYSPKFLTPYR